MIEKGSISIASVGLAVLYMIVTLNAFIPQVVYQVNKSEYAERCVNKHRPGKQCNGKCQLPRFTQDDSNRQMPVMPEYEHFELSVHVCEAEEKVEPIAVHTSFPESRVDIHDLWEPVPEEKPPVVI